jgi:tRNA (guanine-N7-)-methyltransferase
VVEQEAFNLLVEGSNPSRPTISPMSSSRIPGSSQRLVHKQLERVVGRHLQTRWQQPIRQHTRQAFERLEARVPAQRRMIVDAGCGNGESTRQLARMHPDVTVIGVDKSEQRLARVSELPSNALIVRAELADFWRLARLSGWQLARHYLLYPNPWPKPGHLQRRWHAHPVFPDLLGLGGRLEIRTNFELYALEFARALEIAGLQTPEVVSFQVREPLSPFERKYSASGHELYRLIAEL